MRDKIMFIQGMLMKNIISLVLLSLMLPSFVVADDTSIDGQFATPTEMTDKQMEGAKNFTHQGIKDRKIQEGCKDLNNCQEDDGGFPIEKVIGTLYSTMGMMMGTDLKTNKPIEGTGGAQGAQGAQAAQGAQGAQGAASSSTAPKKPETEKKKDYCIMVAAASEIVGGAMQTTMQSKAEKATANINDPQLASLVNLKETHKARAKTASFQRAIYAGVTACYGVMLATGAVMDFNLGIRMAGAATLTVLYSKKISKHKNAAEKVQLVIDSLPKTGECNPWTGTKCFCAEATSKDKYPGEYQEVCVLNAGNFETPKVALGCATTVDSKVTFDKECKCKQTNTCIKTTLSNFANLSGIGTNMLNEANKNFSLLNGGEFDQAKFDAAALSASTLAAKVKLPKTNVKTNLNPEQKKMALELSKYMPANMAAVAASAPANSKFNSGISDSGTSSAAISKLSPELKQKVAEAIKVGYSQGNGNGSSSAGAEEEFVMPGFGPKPEEAQGGTEVISFAEQAVSKADVSNAPETPIFDIISNRYRRSGWNKLDTEGK